MSSTSSDIRSQHHDGQAPQVDETCPDYIVALGASAGGLEALMAFFGDLKAASNAAFVVVQHLSPNHRSMMADLLGRHTHLPVTVIQPGERVRPGHVHLIPPAVFIEMDQDTLRVIPREGHGHSLPIDRFLVSLADQWGSRAMAVILSGTGSDGTVGVQAIHEAGGDVFVQDPASADFDGMPQSAVQAQVSPLVDTAEALGRAVGDRIALPATSERPFELEEAAPAVDSDTSELDDEDVTRSVLSILQYHGYDDFSGYKTDALLQRLNDRRDLLKLPDLNAYMRHLEASDSECHFLAKELLIPLTRFFRDEDVYEALTNDVIAPLVRDRPDTAPIRVWCAGVASGEEAYSLSILFQEAFERFQKWPPLKLFATDVDAGLVEEAAAGVYSGAVADEMSAERLERWFEPVQSGFRVKKNIRQPLVFARHNVIHDPPFTRLDLVLCRNVLIYLQPERQATVLLRLQYALNKGGVLCLGPTETLGEIDNRFEPLRVEQRIYRLKESGRLPPDSGQQPTPAARPARPAPHNAETGAVDALQRRLLRDYLPPTLIVNDRLDLVHVLGDTQPLLVFNQGGASFKLSKLLHPTLNQPAQALAQEALERLEHDQEAAMPEPVRAVMPDNQSCLISIRHHRENAQDYLAISFVPVSEWPTERPDPDDNRAANGSDQSRQIRELKAALEEARYQRQATIEALETLNEERQASNEELHTSNEELQSTNEELQSLNEELHSVNAEHQEKIRQLNQIQQDMDNLSQSLGVASLFVDAGMRILRFTDGMQQYIPLQRGDEGRSLSEFSLKAMPAGLLDEVGHSLARHEHVELELPQVSGNSGWVRVMPYTERHRQVPGAVISVTSMSLIQSLVQQRPFLDALPFQMLLLAEDGRLIMANQPDLDWPMEAVTKLSRSLGLTDDVVLTDQEERLNCRQAWRSASNKGDRLADFLEQACRKDSRKGIQKGKTGVSEFEDDCVTVVVKPVVRGRQHHHLVIADYLAPDRGQMVDLSQETD